MTSEEQPAETSPRVGIVFVHGIGFQEPDATLLDWTTALLAPAMARGTATVVRSSLANPSSASVIEVQVRTAADTTATWMFSEAFWANSIRPPRFERVVEWLGKLAGSAGGSNIGGMPIKSLAASAAQSAVLLAYGVLRTLLSVLPIASLREAVVARIDRLLTSLAGDLLVLADDPIQMANIRLRLRQAVDRLVVDEGCTSIVILAHSGGAAIAVTAIRAGEIAAPAKLITFGQGLALVTELELASATAPRATRSLEGLDWSDYWGTHDPASAGPLPRSVTGVEVHSHPIVNRASLVSDHTTYWLNPEQFVLPVLDEIAGPDARVFRAAPDEAAAMVERRKQRVAALSLWNKYTVVLPIIAAVVAFSRYQAPSFLERVGDAVGDWLGWVPLHDQIVWLITAIRREAETSLFVTWMAAIGSGVLFTLLFVTIVGAVRWLASITRLIPDEQRNNVGCFNFWVGFVGLLPAVAFLAVGVLEGGNGLALSIAPPAAVPPQAIVVVIPIAIMLVALRKGPGSVAVVAGALALVTLLPILAITAAVSSPRVGRLLIGIAVMAIAFGAIRWLGRWRWSVWDRFDRDAVIRGQQPTMWWQFVDGAALLGLAIIATVVFSAQSTITAQVPAIELMLVIAIALVDIGLVRDTYARSRRSTVTLPVEPQASSAE